MFVGETERRGLKMGILLDPLFVPRDELQWDGLIDGQVREVSPMAE